MSNIYAIMDDVFDIVKQKKMVTIDEYRFFDLFVIEQSHEYKNSEGGVDEIDGVNCPYILIDTGLAGKLWLGIKKENIPADYKFTPTTKKLYDYGKRGVLLFAEYEDFCNDPEIGDYVCKNDNDYIRCKVAHEMAHCLQFWNLEPGWDAVDVHKGHNDNWKGYYRILRREMGLVRKQ